jgi:heptosyltransferase III
MNDPSRVLFIATRQIGDVLVTTPLITAARRIWPEAQFDFLGYRGKLDMLKGNPEIHELIETSEHPNLWEYLKLFNRLFQRYDLAIITQPSDRAYFFGSLAALRRVGVVVQDTPKSRQKSAWKRSICMHWVAVDYFKQHVIVEKLKLLEPFYRAKRLDLFANPIAVTPPVGQALTPILQSQLRQPYIVLHPGPLNGYKRWPLAYWAQLIKELVTLKYEVVLSASPAEQDLALNRDILSLLDDAVAQSVIDSKGQLTLSQVKTLLDGADLYIGVDTSVTHLAAACEIPTIALFGPTPPTNFGPWPNGFIGEYPYQLRDRTQIVGNVCILQGPGDCVPCRKAGCFDTANSKSECLDLLEPNQVLAATKQMLSRGTESF